MRKLFSWLLSLMLCASLALPTLAADIEPSQQKGIGRPTHGSIDITYTFEDEHGVSHALEYVLFDLYLVATFDDAHALVNTPKFADVPLDQNLFYDQDLLIDTRNRLDHFVSTNTLTSNYHAYTDAHGVARIDPLPLGLYFVRADLYWNDEVTHLPTHAYYANPFLVQIGARDPETGEYIYDFTAMPKIATIELEPDETMSVSVRKEWKNTANLTLPKEIEVVLYCDGCCESDPKTAVLNAANNWTYTWTGLDPTLSWGVKETNIPNDYDVSYETTIKGEQLVFVITNTYTGPAPTPSPTPVVTPPPTTPTPQLPQTGSHLPYVPVFAGLGMGLILLGALLNKGGEAK